MVSLSDSVNGDLQFLWGWQISTPHKTPEQIDKKIGTIDYIREWASLYTKFCRNPFTGGFWANGWNVTKIICIYLYLFFFDQPTGQTRGWIFTRNSSKEVKSHLMYTVVCTPNKKWPATCQSCSRWCAFHQHPYEATINYQSCQQQN